MREIRLRDKVIAGKWMLKDKARAERQSRTWQRQQASREHVPQLYYDLDKNVILKFTD